MIRALENPPMRREEVGFYGAERNPPLENCVRMLVTELHKSGRLMAAEDKYLGELFPQFEKHITLPRALVELLPFWLDPNYSWEDDGSDPGVRERESLRIAAGLNGATAALEKSFADAGLSLVTWELAGGDHLCFMALPEAVKERWVGVVLARNARGEPLGLRPPDWSTFAGHLGYCLGLKNLSNVDVAAFQWREP
ncbi:MAG: hypothetical protein AAFX94_20000 [Myxococcota bacterium]